MRRRHHGRRRALPHRPHAAYIVKLGVNLLLTTGDSIPNQLIDEVAFCKNSNP